MRNYGIFRDAHLDLSTTVDRPLVLITGNNGAGKTTTLEAIRLALHGRRAFDVPMGETEYFDVMSTRFHGNNRGAPCSIELCLNYVDRHQTKQLRIERSWVRKRLRVAESIAVLQDGTAMDPDDAEDLLTTIVPPEVARYFFFDGERIRELAEWNDEDEVALFSAVGDLLGLGVLDRLEADVSRLLDLEARATRATRDVSKDLAAARGAVEASSAELRTARATARSLRAALERARATVRRMGALQTDEFTQAQERLGALRAEEAALVDEFQRAAHDVLPLACAKTLKARFAKELEARVRIEEREIVGAFLAKNTSSLRRDLKSAQLRPPQVDAVLKVLAGLARGKPLPVSPTLQSVSRADAVWMQRVMEVELPETLDRMGLVARRLTVITEERARVQERLHAAPSDDQAAEEALSDLEARQRAVVEHEAQISGLEAQYAERCATLKELEDLARQHRQEAFRAGRLRLREKLMGNVLEALPALASGLQASKEQRFADYLREALANLWHKSDLLQHVIVSFADRVIDLHGPAGRISKRDLSAGEKQLFSVGLIYALGKMAHASMPLVIDTPLGRLDKAHRRRFVGHFLPSASHQVILLSTDTEIVGPLYDDIAPLVARHYELSELNGGLTDPVQLALA